MHEIDFEKADFDDIEKFARNLLQLEGYGSDTKRFESGVAYFSTMTQVLLGRKASQSAAMLAHSMENARNTLTIQLDRLVMSIDAASKRADDAAKVAAVHERRMVNATRGLVFETVLLAVATLGLVWYTRELALVERAGAEPTIAQPATR